MATIFKRLLTLSVAFGLLLGAAAQLLPCKIAHADMGNCANTVAGGAVSKAPCTGDTPTCIDHFGCISVSAIPIAPASPPVSVPWTSVSYDVAAEALSGMSVEPELAPPILAA
jgi:hypothetical protein